MSLRAKTLVASSSPGRHPVVEALLYTLPGRAILVGLAVRVGAWLAKLAFGPSLLLNVIGAAGTLALLAGLGYFGVRLVGVARRRLLWRVRRKLILSYIFVGFVPALLIIVFCLLCGLLLFATMSQYIVESRLRYVTDQTVFLVRTAALEVGQLGRDQDVEGYLQRKQAALEEQFPASSLAVIPISRTCDGADEPRVARDYRPLQTIVAGPWPHLDPPSALPAWVPCEGFGGLIVYQIPPASSSAAGEMHLAIRAVAPAEGTSPRFAVVLDVPMSEHVARELRRQTGIQLRDVALVGGREEVPPAQPARAGAQPPRVYDPAGDGSLRPQWVVFLDYFDWTSGRTGRATIGISMQIGEVYDQLSPATSTGGISFGRALVLVIVVVGVLFLLIQFAALVMGLALARSITGSVHELFVGTVRVQQGDFSHRIEVKARDQLGELADSFNQMTSRLTELLAQMAEKKRLEEELRIARQIQMSLLPQGPAHMPGLAMTAHCSPAREVGGDYYDFLPLDDHRIGILIADVSGKGTSAALYMAELKGLMLSLCQIHQSPRDLMIAANRIIAGNVDSRSFITMIYAVIDLERRTMTYARAGHTPLIHLPGHGEVRRARILVPDGMVLGLKIDNGEKFAELLEEATIPLERGDLFVLYTDGITEAMSPDEDLFGEGRLGELIEDNASLPFDELRERILRDVRVFTGEPGPHDDMTLILIKVEDVPAGAHADARAAAVATA